MSGISDTTRFADQVVIISGGARGIGLAIARRFHQEGAHVVIGDIDRTRAEQEAERLAGTLALELDVQRPASWQNCVEAALRVFGKVDILVNNAGIAGRTAPTWELGADEWQAVIDVDLSGTFYGCHAVLPCFLMQGSGCIINMASIAGKEGNPNAVPYSAAKAGVIGLTKAVAKEVIAAGIRVHAVAPSVIETELLEQMSSEHRQYMLQKVPLGRLGRPEEVAALVAWLASSECSFSTGAVFDLSGGRATY